MRHPSLVPLSEDHHHGLALALRCRKQALGQIKPMGVEGLHERAREIREFFTNNLVSHFRAEEEVLFPTLHSAAEESHAIIDDLLHQHEEIRRAVAQLDVATHLSKLIFDIGDLLERHIRKEERELFPFFERLLSARESEAVGRKITEILQTRDRR